MSNMVVSPLIDYYHFWNVIWFYLVLFVFGVSNIRTTKHFKIDFGASFFFKIIICEFSPN